MYSNNDLPNAAAAERLRQLFSERMNISQEAFVDFHFHEYVAREGGFRSPGQVSDYLHGFVPFDVLAAIKFARVIRCSVDDIDGAFREEIDSIALNSKEFSSQCDLAEARGERLKELVRAIPGLLGLRHDAVKQRVISNVRNSFANADSPEEIEGVKNGLEFFGVLKWHGSDHGLYQWSMDVLDADIRCEIRNMESEDQLALLLPLCGRADYVEEMLVEECLEEWPEILLKHASDEWEERLRDWVLDCVKERNPHDFPEIEDSEG